jgi:hypothetical protein
MTNHPFYDRFRVVVSDPMNSLIVKHPNAGKLDDGWVTMHNGQLVKYGSYYGPELGNFFDIMLINGGVHEPQEEYAFQEVIKSIKDPKPSMLELGAYWSFYSMWFLQQHPEGVCTMVEPNSQYMDFGRDNFNKNGLTGKFINDYVSPCAFSVDPFLENGRRLSILHADIQGSEVDMLRGASKSLNRRAIDWVFISSHSDELHKNCIDILKTHNYRIIAEADAEKSFCFDGIIVACSPDITFDGIDFSDRRNTPLVPESIVDDLLKNVPK